MVKKNEIPLVIKNQEELNNEDCVFLLKKTQPNNSAFQSQVEILKTRRRSRTVSGLHNMFNRMSEDEREMKTAKNAKGSSSSMFSSTSSSPSPSPSSSPLQPPVQTSPESLVKLSPLPSSSQEEEALRKKQLTPITSSESFNSASSSPVTPLSPIIPSKNPFHSSPPNPNNTMLLSGGDVSEKATTSSNPVTKQSRSIPDMSSLNFSPLASANDIQMLKRKESRQRSNSSPWLLYAANNVDAQRLNPSRGTIRVSFRSYSEHEHYKTIWVESNENTSEIIRRALEKYQIQQGFDEFNLYLNYLGNERLLEGNDFPLIVKRQVYTNFDPQNEPTFVLQKRMPRSDEKLKKSAKKSNPLFSKLIKSDENIRKRRKSDLIDALKERFGERAEKGEKVFIHVELELGGSIVFEDEEFIISATDTAKQLIQKVIEKARAAVPQEKLSVIQVSRNRTEKVLKLVDNISKQKNKHKASLGDPKYVVRKTC